MSSYHLRDINPLIEKTVYILREVKARFKKPCLLWSTGKDSTALLHITKQAFFGKIPFDVVHIDTHQLFSEMYEFRDKLIGEWNIPLKVAHKEDCKDLVKNPTEQQIFNCCMCKKTLALKELFQREHYDAAILGIRWDELGVRSKEHVFSPRTHEWEWKIVRKRTKKEQGEGDSPFIPMTEPELWGIYQADFGETCEHVRVHPMLHWSEIEVWEYIKKYNVPFVSLYSCWNGVTRYRSLGCGGCTKPIKSTAKTIEEFQEEIYNTTTREREGRKQKDMLMEKLRHLGYMALIPIFFILGNYLSYTYIGV